MSPRRLVGWVIVVGAVARIGLAIPVGLGVDESYAVSAARQVSLSYFDHPPLSFWLAHGAAVVFGSESHFVVRLPFVLLFALTTWLMYRMTARAFGERAGAVAAVALNLSAVFTVSTGSWVLPDGPLMCALCASAYCLVRVLLDADGEPAAAWRWWLGAGAAAGLALLSKYQATLFLAGVALFVTVRPRPRVWLRRPEPYVAVALALAMFAPVIVWNANHGWASFAFQLGRGGGASTSPVTPLRRVGALGQNVVGQIAWVLPWIWIPLMAALVGAMRRRPSDDRRWFFACLAVVPIGLFTAMAVGGQPGLPHWPASGYLFAFPLLGAAVAGRRGNAADRDVGPIASTSADRRWLFGSTVALAVLAAVAASATLTGWPARALPNLLRRGDPTLEGVDWTDLRPPVDSVIATLPRPAFVAATSWAQAGKVAYALGPGVSVLCLSGDPRHFGFLHDPRTFLGQDAVIVDRWPTRHDIVAQYGPYFDGVTLVGHATVRRAGRAAFDVGVYVGRRFQRPYPATALPPGAVPWGSIPAAAPSVSGGDYLPPDLEHLIQPERAP